MIDAAAVRQTLQRRVDLGLLDVGDRPLERDVGKFADFELRQHFERDLEIEVAARLQRRVDLVALGGQLDLGLHRQPQAVVVDDLLVARR